MAIDPAIINGALQEIRREAASRRGIMALAESLSDLNALHTEIESAKQELAALRNGQEAIQLQRDDADKVAQDKATRRTADADKYYEQRKDEADGLLTKARAQADKLASDRKAELDGELEVHQSKIEPLIQEHKQLEQTKAEHLQAVESLRDEHAELDRSIKAKRSELDQVKAQHAEFLRSIGAK